MSAWDKLLAKYAAPVRELRPRDWDRQQGELVFAEMLERTGQTRWSLRRHINASLASGELIRRAGADGKVYFCPTEKPTRKPRSPEQSPSSP